MMSRSLLRLVVYSFISFVCLLNGSRVDGITRFDSEVYNKSEINNGGRWQVSWHGINNFSVTEIGTIVHGLRFKNPAAWSYMLSLFRTTAYYVIPLGKRFSVAPCATLFGDRIFPKQSPQCPAELRIQPLLNVGIVFRLNYKTVSIDNGRYNVLHSAGIKLSLCWGSLSQWCTAYSLNGTQSTISASTFDPQLFDVVIQFVPYEFIQRNGLYLKITLGSISFRGLMLSKGSMPGSFGAEALRAFSMHNCGVQVGYSLSL